MDHPREALLPISRVSLNGQVYATLRSALLEGQLVPHQRLKIRDLAAAMRVSETPVREAVMQLVRERALVLQTSRSLTVPRLTRDQYQELRRIRMELEGLAAAEAARHVTPATIRQLERLHARLVRAEATGNAQEAVRINWHFHSLICRDAGMPELLNLIEGIWLRVGPLLTYLYPRARPTYPGRHRHLDVIDGLRDGDPAAVRAAIRADLLEGGAGLLQLLTELDEGRLDETAARGEAPAPSLDVLTGPEGPHLRDGAGP